MFIKAQLSSQISSIVDFSVSFILDQVFGLWYVICTFLGAVSGGIVNCCINYQWVFRAQGLKKKHVAIKYFMVWTGSIGLNTGGTYLLTEWSGQYFLLAKAVVSLLVGFLWNYQLQRLFVYRDVKIKQLFTRKRNRNIYEYNREDYNYNKEDHEL